MKHITDDDNYCLRCGLDLITHEDEIAYHNERRRDKLDPSECDGCNCDHDCRFDRHIHDETCEHYDDCIMHPDYVLEQAFKLL